MNFDDVYRTSSETVAQRDNDSRHYRYRRLYDAFQQVSDLNGFVVDCGVLRGLSTHMLCSMAQTGNRIIAIDSFEGLSRNLPEDGMDSRTFDKKKAKFTIAQEVFAENLKEFPDLVTIKGWIPKILTTLPEQTYKFVHIDVDMYEPTLGCLKYFWPRLAKNGIVVCDDYSSGHFKGAKVAIDKFCKKHKIVKDIDVSAILCKVSQ